ncbi:hypothetical protein A2V61_01915 [Candidatus Woesebacteria bacterium RBG_19FT_COMBO_47_8]|nr:MAG: hypothetical protein A2V61_01915 [Candidatus Woesebacteria bacterium RBG_19FT_COMBO_47_8]
MKNKGFTLVEIVVTLAITMIMTTIIYVAINATQRSASGIEGKITAQQDEKAALSVMEMEIRMASFNPSFVPDDALWLNRATCAVGDFSANPSYKGIQEATANSITIQMDTFLDPTLTPPSENGVIGDDNEIIRYNYDTTAANRYITRATNCGPAQPFLGAAGGSGVEKTVNVINNELGIPVFRYFDGVGTDISATVVSNPGSQTVGILAIRRIDIILAVETEFIDKATKQRRRMIYSSSVIVRNHAPEVSGM